MPDQLLENQISSLDQNSRNAADVSSKDDGVVIHTMPKNLDQSFTDKKTGKKEKKINENQNFKPVDPQPKIKKFFSRSKIFYFIIGGLILAVLIAAVLVYFFIFKNPTPPAITEPTEPPIEQPVPLIEEPIEPPLVEPQPDLIQKVQNIYNDQGEIEESVVLSLAKETNIDFNQISLTEYQTEDEVMKKYLASIFSRAYYLDLKNQNISRPAVLTITYSYSMLIEKELLSEDLKIGFLDIVNFTSGLTKWEINSDVQLDENLNSVSIALPKTKSGIFALVKKDINDFLPQAPAQIDYGPQDFLPVARDTDIDGLSDTEEAIFSTDPNAVDTDKDGFTDYKEILNLYSPIKIGKAVLINDGTFVLYQNPKFQYYLLYPKEWKVNSVDESAREIVFSSTANLEKKTIAGEFIVISIADNPGKLPLKDWYLLTSAYAKAEDVKDYSLPGFKTISTVNELTIYLTAPEDNSIIYAINYDAGIQTELNYKTVFLLLQKTFTFKVESLNPQLGQENILPPPDNNNSAQVKLKEIFPAETINQCLRDNLSFTENTNFLEESGNLKEYNIKYKCYPVVDELNLKIIETASILNTNSLAINLYGHSLLYLKDNISYLNSEQTAGFWLSDLNLIYFKSQENNTANIKELINLYDVKYARRELPIKLKERDVFSAPQSRDEKRIQDMGFIKQRLYDFQSKSEDKKYPSDLTILGEDAPVDLTLTGDAKPYNYQITEDGLNFQIKFILEVGFSDYSAGEHILTEEGIE